MARILYGVQGDARGHLNRSLTVAGLLAGHEILFAGAGVVAETRDLGFAYEPLPLLGTTLRHGRVDVAATLQGWTRALAGYPAWVGRLTGIIRAFDPALIITDYEFFTSRAARKAGRPCISLDHQHVLTRTRHEPPPGQGLNRIITETCIRVVAAPVSRHLITSFHRPPVKDPARDEIFGTLVGADVLPLAPRDGEHAVVYIRGGNPDTLRRVLGGRHREYRIYGFGPRPDQGNLRFRATSRHGFLEDLASAAYVLSNGGHGLLSEALHLGKPVFCVPTRMFYEQLWNGHHLHRLGYGQCHPSLDLPPGCLDRFEADLDRYRANIAAASLCGREALRRRLAALLDAA
jgi:uncharacterized protein (TIGR00661 family)